LVNSPVTETISRAIAPLVVSADLGPAGTGSASAPRFVRVRERGRDEFSIKCSDWIRPPHPYLCANEWIAGLVALQCGLPTLAMFVIQHPDGLAVGWERLSHAMWATLGTHPQVLDAAENADSVYEMVVFDALVRNIDRHAGNIVARRVSQRSTLYQLFVYDHDRTLVLPGETPATLAVTPQFDAPALWIREAGIRWRITDAGRLREAIRSIQGACSASALRTIVDSTPTNWLPVAERSTVFDFLADRAGDLEAIVDHKASVVLPSLR
jgi:hypothetical protein